MNIRIKAYPDNQTKIIYLKISNGRECGAPGYDIAPYHDVSHVTFEGIEDLAERGYLVETSLEGDCHVVKKSSQPFFRFMKSNDLLSFID